MVALIDVVPFMLLIVGIMGAIYTGCATPTEAAAIGCIWLASSSRRSGASSLAGAEGGDSTVMVSGNILLITYTAFVFSYAMSVAGVGEQLTTLIIGAQSRSSSSSSRC